MRLERLPGEAAETRAPARARSRSLRNVIGCGRRFEGAPMAAGVHHVARRHGDGMAAHGVRAATGDAGDRRGDRRALGVNSAPVCRVRRGLAEAGYAEGKNLAIEARAPGFRPELGPSPCAIWFVSTTVVTGVFLCPVAQPAAPHYVPMKWSRPPPSIFMVGTTGPRSANPGRGLTLPTRQCVTEGRSRGVVLGSGPDPHTGAWVGIPGPCRRDLLRPGSLPSGG
jgi:hypothetical protein